MDEVRVVRKRTHVWPVAIAIIILAIVIAYAFFAMNGGARPELGWLPGAAPAAGAAVDWRT